MATVTLEQLGFDLKPKDITREWKKQKFITLGPSKSGKTTFWAQSEKHFFLRTEAGHNHVKTVGADCRDYKELDGWITKLVQAKAAGIFPFDLVCIDTGDRLLDYITEDILDWARNKYPKSDITGIGDVPEGNGWFMLKQKTNMLLNKLEDLPCAININFHTAQDTRNEEFDTKKTYKKDTINVGGKTGTAILAWADHVIHIKSAFVGEMLARKLILKGSKTVEAGSRANLPNMDWSADDAKNFATFRALFN